LRSRQPHHRVIHARPAELAILQPLGEQTHTGAVPVNQLHPVSSLRSKDVDGARERISLHGLSHQRRQSLGALAEVDWPRRNQHPDCTRQADHPPAFRRRRTAATVLTSAPRPIRTVIPAVTTSMSPQIRSEPWACLRRRTGAPPAGAFVSITAGTNFGPALSMPGLADARACRRQVKTCCGVSPRRRATSETTAPATSVSATTSLLKSSENCRRRPVPVITSSRRTSVASGLSVWSSVDISRSPSRDQQNRPSRRLTERWDHHSAYNGHRSRSGSFPNSPATCCRPGAPWPLRAEAGRAPCAPS